MCSNQTGKPLLLKWFEMVLHLCASCISYYVTRYSCVFSFTSFFCFSGNPPPPPPYTQPHHFSFLLLFPENYMGEIRPGGRCDSLQFDKHLCINMFLMHVMSSAIVSGCIILNKWTLILIYIFQLYSLNYDIIV